MLKLVYWYNFCSSLKDWRGNLLVWSQQSTVITHSNTQLSYSHTLTKDQEDNTTGTC